MVWSFVFHRSYSNVVDNWDLFVCMLAPLHNLLGRPTPRHAKDPICVLSRCRLDSKTARKLSLLLLRDKYNCGGIRLYFFTAARTVFLLHRLPTFPSPSEMHWPGNLGSLYGNKEIHYKMTRYNTRETGRKQPWAPFPGKINLLNLMEIH